jgi:hypothetical protein
VIRDLQSWSVEALSLTREARRMKFATLALKRGIFVSFW